MAPTSPHFWIWIGGLPLKPLTRATSNFTAVKCEPNCPHCSEDACLLFGDTAPALGD